MGGAAREARLPHESRAPSDANAACATTSGTNRTSPKCVRCRNHNEVSLLSGHKRFCRFRHCVCRNCQRTVKRQKKMAKQIAIRRRKKLEEERGELVPAATPPSPSTSSVDSADPPTGVPIWPDWLLHPNAEGDMVVGGGGGVSEEEGEEEDDWEWFFFSDGEEDFLLYGEEESDDEEEVLNEKKVEKEEERVEEEEQVREEKGKQLG
uniref:Dsx common transcript product n=1 Tax=Nilaparvata lugens TaxID=108931 RepID=A0A2S1UGC9_NILLU|nr:Dsx common transcript product [Nilaparvata lugens]